MIFKTFIFSKEFNLTDIHCPIGSHQNSLSLILEFIQIFNLTIIFLICLALSINNIRGCHVVIKG